MNTEMVPPERDKFEIITELTQKQAAANTLIEEMRDAFNGLLSKIPIYHPDNPFGNNNVYLSGFDETLEKSKAAISKADQFLNQVNK